MCACALVSWRRAIPTAGAAAWRSDSACWRRCSWRARWPCSRAWRPCPSTNSSTRSPSPSQRTTPATRTRRWRSCARCAPRRPSPTWCTPCAARTRRRSGSGATPTSTSHYVNAQSDNKVARFRANFDLISSAK